MSTKNVIKFLIWVTIGGCLFFTSAALSAQRIDSLIHLLADPASDTLKINLYCELASEFSRQNIDQGILYADSAQVLARAKNITSKIPIINYHYAILYRNKGDFENSHKFLDLFFEDPATQSDSAEIIKGLQVRTTIFFEEDKYEETVASAQKLFRLSHRHDDTQGQISGLSFMALVLSAQNKPLEAIEIYQQAIDICHQTGDSTRLAAMYNNLAGAYLKAHDFDKSIAYYELTKTMDEKDNFTWGIFNSYHNIGNVYIWKEDFKKAYLNLKKAYDLQIEIGSTQELNMTAYKLGYVMAKTGKVAEGISMLEHSLEIAHNNNYRAYEEQAQKYLSEIFADQQEFAKALHYYREYKSTSDSIWLDQLNAKTDELQIQYATAEREAHIAGLNSENKLKDLQLRQASKTRINLMIGLFLLALVAVLIWRNSWIRMKANRSLAQKNKIIADSLQEKDILLREIHHRVKNNLQIISSLLSLQSRSIEDTAVKDAMKAGQDRVRSMALIHQNLYQEGDLIGVDAKNYITSLTSSLWHSYNIETDRISLITEIDPVKLDVDIMIPMGLILNELISNSLKYAFRDGRPGSVQVSLKEEKEKLQLVVKDNGLGFNQKSPSLQKKTMGMKLINAFTQKLHGEIQIKSSDGTEIVLLIPHKKAA
jgi:two-component sensor histidine kinase